MMTLEEFIDQYRISDGRRYCKLEEGLQWRYTRQVYESYIDYAYECEEKISEKDFCTLNKVYGIGNYIKEKENYKRQGSLPMTLQSATDALELYEKTLFTKEFGNLLSTQIEKIVEINEDVMDLFNINIDFNEFNRYYNDLNDNDKRTFHLLVAYYTPIFPIQQVIYHKQVISFPLNKLAHARSLFLKKWREEKQKDSKYKKLQEQVEEQTRKINGTSKTEEKLIYIGMGVGVILFIGVVAIALDIISPFFSMVFNIFADGTILGSIFGIFAIIITLAFIITTIKNISGK